MKNNQLKFENEATLVIEYTDPEEGFKGWLVIDKVNYPLCAGGMRVQKGITREHITKMARNMTRKMKTCGLPIDGAKCGIDYDHTAPGKKAAMARFMRAIKPYIETCYSMGPDLNTDMDELESIGRDIGVQSIKMAIAQAQGLDLNAFQRRYDILSQEVYKGWPLGKIRAGHGVAAATLATLDFLKIPLNTATVAIQGFGALAKAAALGLIKAGVQIVTIADSEKSIQAKSGCSIDMDLLLRTEGTLLPDTTSFPEITSQPNSTIFDTECDILLLAAIENAVTVANANRLKCKAVVPGANLAVTKEAEKLLNQKGIIVLPCFLAGCGGSLSMNGLFGPAEDPSPKEVLGFIERRMGEIVTHILQESARSKTTPTETAEHICRTAITIAREKPYQVL